MDIKNLNSGVRSWSRVAVAFVLGVVVGIVMGVVGLIVLMIVVQAAISYAG